MQLESWDESASFTEEDYYHFKVSWQGKMKVKKQYEKSNTSIQLLTLPCWYCGSQVNFAFLMKRTQDWRITCLHCHDLARRTQGIQGALTECGMCHKCQLYNGVVVRNGQELAVCTGCFMLVKEIAEKGIV